MLDEGVILRGNVGVTSAHAQVTSRERGFKVLPIKLDHLFL